MKWLRNFFSRPAARPATALGPTVSSGQPVALPIVSSPQAPRAEDLPPVWVEAICHVSDKTLALEWLTQFNDEPGLGQVALRARSAETRFAAVQRIESSALLETIAQASRDKDKRVYRHCADSLKQRRRAEVEALRASEISAVLHSLLAAAPLPNTRLLELNQELAGLVQAGSAGEACRALMQQALAQLHQESEALRDLHVRHQSAIALTDTLVNSCGDQDQPGSEVLDEWRSRAASLRQAGENLPDWLANQPAARSLDEVLAVIEARLSGFAEQAARLLACEQWLAEVEAGNLPVADAAAGWPVLPKPDHVPWRAGLEARWQALQPTPVVEVSVEAVIEVSAPVADEPVKPAPTRHPPVIDREAASKLLDQLQQAIAEGHLIDADAAAKRIKHQLAGNRLPGALESRLHGLQAELETLRGWARWGAGQARDNLIEAARQLLVGEQEAEALGVAISELREEWKRLNSQAAASKAQWETFDALLEQAYQPVAAYRAEQALRYAEARALREALCGEWEAELAGMDWTQADFKVVEARRVDMIKQWRAAPPAGFRDERVLRKRFDALIHLVDQQLAAAHAAELARREQLIAAAEALAGQADLRLAMTEAKALRQSWNQPAMPVRLKHADERKQWSRFDAACNQVFARLEAQRAEQAAQRLEQTRERELQQQARQHLEQEQRTQHRARFALLAEKAALAQRVESAALSGNMLEAVLAETQQAWDVLGRLPGQIEARLARRFAAASRATEAELAAGQVTREALLLDLEISLGLPSPAHVAEVRRERQLSRLRNRFASSTDEHLEPERLLVGCYATPALPDPTCERRLADALRKMSDGTAPHAAPELARE